MSELKECSRCYLPKDTSEFRKHKTYCKSCENLQTKEYKLNHKKEIEDYNKQYKSEHKEETQEYNKQYKTENRNEINTYKRNYESERRDSNPTYKLRQNVSSYINIMLKANGGSKNGESCLKYVPYSIEKLKEHLEFLFEPWMTWDNWGVYDWQTWNDSDQTTWKWQIDHIIPQSDLPYSSMEDENFNKCWSLDNLRPLSAKQNALDGATKIRHKTI